MHARHASPASLRHPSLLVPLLLLAVLVLAGPVGAQEPGEREYDAADKEAASMLGVEEAEAAAEEAVGEGEAPLPDPGLAVLAEWLSGSFSSGGQAEAEEGYLDVRLQLVPIWTEREDGPWLYVEQAAAIAREEPYRQRVYQLARRDDGTYESRIFTLPGDPLRFAGAWQRREPLAELSPADLEPREGCTVHLRWNGRSAFVGGTRDRDCPSDLRGASWASSIVQVREDRLVTWDRGFDEKDRQVWGAEDGGYVFLRVD